jgi:hypothetical protein
MSVAWIDGTTGPSESPAKGTSDGPIPAYPVARLPGRSSDRALLFRGHDAYALLNPHATSYESLKRLSDSEVLTLALLQQLRGMESERSFLRDAEERFFSHLFPGVVGLHPSSFHRRVRKLGRFLEPLRREVLPELVGEPETLIVDSTLLEVLRPRQVSQSAGWGVYSTGAAWVRWGSFAVYGVKLHLLCAANRVPISYELTPANTAEVKLTEELLVDARLEEGLARAGSSETWPTPKRVVGANPGRRRHPTGDRTLPTIRQEATGGDSVGEPQARVPARGDVGDYPRGVGNQDRD